MVLDVVEVSRTGFVSADEGENIDPEENEESTLLDKDDAAEAQQHWIHKRENFIHGVQQERQCVNHLAKTRQGAYLEYTQIIMLQHQGKDPLHTLSAALNSNVSPGTPKRGIASRLTGAGSLLPSIYSEAWGKGNTKFIPRTPFSSLWDATHCKHVGCKTNGVSRKQIKQHNQNI
ncbi:hypothetical protein TNCV_3921161 [Trichonephila clavipes]|nr:hypothetical protein TNCV_3921161 [Trichonephila clavipes]